jgi:hypothetical protein
VFTVCILAVQLLLLAVTAVLALLMSAQAVQVTTGQCSCELALVQQSVDSRLNSADSSASVTACKQCMLCMCATVAVNTEQCL